MPSWKQYGHMIAIAAPFITRRRQDVAPWLVRNTVNALTLSAPIKLVPDMQYLRPYLRFGTTRMVVSDLCTALD